MPGLNPANTTGFVTLEAPSTTTTNCADDLLPSPDGTTTLICVALSNRICAGKPSKVTATFLPDSVVPISVEMDPGTAGPAAKVAPLTMLVTVGRTGVGAVTTNVMGMVALLLCGSAFTVKTARY